MTESLETKIPSCHNENTMSDLFGKVMLGLRITFLDFSSDVILQAKDKRENTVDVIVIHGNDH